MFAKLVLTVPNRLVAILTGSKSIFFNLKANKFHFRFLFLQKIQITIVFGAYGKLGWTLLFGIDCTLR